MAAHFRGSARVHRLFVANYVVLGVFFCVLCSDECGEPVWYGQREHPPVTPEGRLQYVSEHLMRCKYSDNALLRQVPWLTVYAFAVLLMQMLHTWVSLHMIEALQVRSAVPAARPTPAPRCSLSRCARAYLAPPRRALRSGPPARCLCLCGSSDARALRLVRRPRARAPLTPPPRRSRACRRRAPRRAAPRTRSSSASCS